MPGFARQASTLGFMRTFYMQSYSSPPRFGICDISAQMTETIVHIYYIPYIHASQAFFVSIFLFLGHIIAIYSHFQQILHGAHIHVLSMKLQIFYLLFNSQ